MLAANCPRHLVFAGRGLNFAGAGRAPGSHAYVSPADGQVVEVYFAKAVSVGNAFALCTVANNNGMPTVRVDHALLNGSGPVKLGQVLMVAINFEAGGPRAKAVWPVEAKPVVRPASVEKLGTIRVVKDAGYGFIAAADGTSDAFFHVSEARDFMPAMGMSVRFTPKTDPQGRPQAVNVRLA